MFPKSHDVGETKYTRRPYSRTGEKEYPAHAPIDYTNPRPFSQSYPSSLQRDAIRDQIISQSEFKQYLIDNFKTENTEQFTI